MYEFKTGNKKIYLRGNVVCINFFLKQILVNLIIVIKTSVIILYKQYFDIIDKFV